MRPLANPYLMPATEHFRNRITLHVKVPVLSENMYFTCNVYIIFFHINISEIRPGVPETEFQSLVQTS